MVDTSFFVCVGSLPSRENENPEKLLTLTLTSHTYVRSTKTKHTTNYHITAATHHMSIYTTPPTTYLPMRYQPITIIIVVV